MVIILKEIQFEIKDVHYISNRRYKKICILTHCYKTANYQSQKEKSPMHSEEKRNNLKRNYILTVTDFFTTIRPMRQ